jgi:hypothetical protein
MTKNLQKIDLSLAQAEDNIDYKKATNKVVEELFMKADLKTNIWARWPL